MDERKTTVRKLLVITILFIVVAGCSDKILTTTKTDLEENIIPLETDIHKVYYGDTTYMAVSNAKYDMWYVNKQALKNAELNGEFIVFYDKNLTDTAINVNLDNGIYNGLYRQWDREDKYLNQECYYKDGYRPNTCYDYVYYFGDNFDLVHKDSILIEIYLTKYYVENGKEIAGQVFFKYKTIHHSQYEKATGVIRKKTSHTVKDNE